MRTQKMNVKGREILLIRQREDDYISLTDIAKYKNAETTGLVISHWLSTRYTVEFMGIWEQIHNPVFNVTEFSNIKNQSGSNGFVLSGKQWAERTNGIGIVSKAGRYGGGTFAHADIAFEFASWISPEFKLYLIKEFQRLKEDENKRLALGWDIKRNLVKINYKIHTDAIKAHLIPAKISQEAASFIYASEADLLNKALFGFTAGDWQEAHRELDGNIRDHANAVQLVCLANLESLNAEFIRQSLPSDVRLIQLNEIAIIQMTSLVGNNTIKRLNA